VNETVEQGGKTNRRFCRLDRIERVKEYEQLFDLLAGAEQIVSAKEQTEVGMAFLRVPTNTLTHNPRSPVAQGFSQLSC